MKPKQFLYWFLIVITAVSGLQHIGAQVPVKLRSTLSNGGQSKIVVSSNKSISIQQSIGQSSVINSFRVNGFMLRQGFIQPHKVFEKSETTNYLRAMVSPNPFSANIRVSIADEITEILHIAIFDLYGHLVLNKHYDNSQELALDLNYLTSGLYILKINTGEKHLVTKLIKE